MSELYDSGDYNNSKFEYVGPTKDVSFYEYNDSKELFNAIKNNQIRLDAAIKRQNEFSTKLSNMEIGKKKKKKKMLNKEKCQIILINFIFLEKFLIFLKIMQK